MFKNGNGSNRDIAIEISEDYIEFFFAINVKRHKEYLQYMEETEQTLSEEEKQFNS